MSEGPTLTGVQVAYGYTEILLAHKPVVCGPTHVVFVQGTNEFRAGLSSGRSFLVAEET